MKKELDDITYEEFLELQDKFNNNSKSKIATYSFSRITMNILRSLLEIRPNIDDFIFNEWFENDIKIYDENIIFLKNLIEKESKYIKFYNEKDLEINFLIPILNKIDFKINQNIRAFSQENITYKTDKFIFNGEPDFFVAEGLDIPKKPYFFIQEFKRDKDRTNPEAQLLAEMICAVELNDWKIIKGAYIRGAIWNFVILEKLAENEYQYFESKIFNSSNIEDLKSIYKNLLFVKNEIIEMVKNEKKENEK